MNRSKIGIITAVLAGLLCLTIIILHEPNSPDIVLVNTVDSLVTEECQDEFGIDASDMNVIKGKIDRNQFLADILLPYNISYNTIASVAEKSKAVYDIRKLNAGKNYTLICNVDSIATAEFFIYELSPVEFVVYDLRDTVSIYFGERPVTLEERTASGIIHSSLYQTLIDQKLSPALAMELADIYAWTIDFYRIQKGDYFKLIYTVKKVDDDVVGVDNIEASIFNHYDSPFYAFNFQQGERSDYFDEQGNSLRKAFLQAPLKFSRISSGYTKRRFHPVQKRWKAHLGTDYAAPSGTPIMAVGDGIVTEARYKKFNGNYVKIKHNGTYTTQYLHMSKIASEVKPGVRVRQGQIIGYVGSTGLATGPHVCFRFWKHGVQVDHRREKLPPSEPIKDEYREPYKEHLNIWKQRLDKISLPQGAEEVSGTLDFAHSQ
ncbi:MAG: peptidoglycan DD-metalloendopeptidase family protein [Salibacteraceae bacterium]